MNDDERHEFDVGPGDELQRKYGWYAENRPGIVVNPDEVPPHLRALPPFVESWAISCDITRRDYFELCWFGPNDEEMNMLANE